MWVDRCVSYSYKHAAGTPFLDKTKLDRVEENDLNPCDKLFHLAADLEN